MRQSEQVAISRRKLISVLTVGGVAVIAAPSQWTKPVVNAVVLPAHAQTSICVADTTVGGPLTGNPYGALNCADACAAEADNLGAQLCAVSESLDGGSNVICSCDVDLP